MSVKKPKQRWTGKWTSLSTSKEEHIEERRRSEDSNSDQESYDLSKIKKEDEEKEEHVDIEGSPTPPHPPDINHSSTEHLLTMQSPIFLPSFYTPLPFQQPNMNIPIFPHPLLQHAIYINQLHNSPNPTHTLHKPTPTRPFNRVPSPDIPDSTLGSPRARNDTRDDKKKLKKDEETAIMLGLTPEEIEMVTIYPMDEFQDFCNEKEFTEEQLTLIKDFRRRGKNKIAAQNCRKRKIDNIEDLEIKLENKEAETIKEKKRKENLEEMKRYEEKRLKNIKEAILRKMGKNPSVFKVEVNESMSQVEIITREN